MNLLTSQQKLMVNELNSELRNIAGSFETISELFSDNSDFKNIVTQDISAEWENLLRVFNDVQHIDFYDVAHCLTQCTNEVTDTLNKVVR